MLGWVSRAGLWGPLALVVFYVVCCVFLIPGSIPTLGAGFLFGLPVGSITAMVGSTLGACVAFLLGRTTIRRWVARRIARSCRFTAIDDAIGERGFQLVLLSRLSPISPFILLNYAFGLTKVSLREYLWGSLIGMLPGTILFVYLGAGLRSLADVAAYASGQGGSSPLQQALFWGGLLAMAAVALALARLARGALQRAVCSQAPQSVQAPEDDRT
ncbi:MAG: hypothetical protein A2Y77_08725 [Planctomycetes bacterium RBG_13_62_9]|nr:MAG: hypothetical protein A2Y77_08725 [Planctomycetes bacterium RBG_13_62_9]